MNWTRRYVGIPHRERGRERSGVDCWGLVCLVYRDELNIALPSYVDGPCAAERAEIATIAGKEAASLGWRKVGHPQPFDVLLFQRAGLVSHFGLFVMGDTFLHVEEGGDVVRSERLSRTHWGRRMEGHGAGIYRHRDRVSG